MNLGTLAVRNLTRNRLRVALTVVGVGMAVLAFLLIRTVLWAWNIGAESGAKDRLGTRHRISFIMFLPKRYLDDARKVPGVKVVTSLNWFGGKDPKDDRNFFPNFAVPHDSFLDAYPEIVISPEAKQRWLTDPQAALVGADLARKMGVVEGGKVTLKGTIYPGDWEFHVAGIYTTTAMSMDKSELFFHFDYLNNRAIQPMKDQVGFLVTRIDDPSRSADIAKAIDALFEERDIQTLTMSERALNLSFMGMFSAVLSALDIVSLVILLIMTLILGNTIAMGVRERSYEYGVMRAIGFGSWRIVNDIVGEGLFIGLLGGLVGLGLALPLVPAIKQVIDQTPLASFFPFFQIPVGTAVVTVCLAAALGALAAAIPSLRASRLSVIDALRRVG